MKEKREAKIEEMKENYADVINEIAVLNGVDLGVGFDMLLAICRGGEYQGDIEIDTEELKKDYEELLALEVQL